MTTEQLQVNHRYLVKEWNHSEIVELTVLEITERAYKFKYATGWQAWRLKGEFDGQFKVIEDLGAIALPQFDF